MTDNKVIHPHISVRHIVQSLYKYVYSPLEAWRVTRLGAWLGWPASTGSVYTDVPVYTGSGCVTDVPVYTGPVYIPGVSEYTGSRYVSKHCHQSKTRIY